MIYSYGMERFLYQYLLTHLPINSIRNIHDNNKLRKLVKPNDLVLFWGWGKGDRKLQRDLVNMGVKVFPDGEKSLFLGDKIEQLTFVDKITKYPLERIMFKGDGKTLNEYRTPKLESSEKVVLKVGDEHQGSGKYLKNVGNLVRSRENIIFEEFIDNARSIRILLITDKKEDTFVVDYIPQKYSKYNIETRWIGNVDCDNITYNYNDRNLINILEIDKIIEDALNVKKQLNLDYVGIDYVINEDKIGLLEVNDMIGLPEDSEEVKESAKRFFLEMCNNHLNNEN